ncbi:MAG: hypothetical protein ACR2MY_07705 [Candidatus Dormibacteria bacterium]
MPEAIGTDTDPDTLPATKHTGSGAEFRRWGLDLRITWVLLIAIAIFPILAPVADIVGVAKDGLPADHHAAFAAIAGGNWSSFRISAPGAGRFVSVLEVGYALHELVFGILALLIVVIPFRHGERWAWFACWALLVADAGYTLTFANHDAALFRQSLFADLATPALLLAQLRRFFGQRPVG